MSGVVNAVLSESSGSLMVEAEKRIDVCLWNANTYPHSAPKRKLATLPDECTGGISRKVASQW